MINLREKIKNLLLRNNLISESFLKRRRKYWTRVICDESTERLVSGIKPEILTVLEISGNRWENLFKYKSYTSLSYPEFDIQNIDNLGKTYDLIILEHVLEHVHKPNLAIKNIYKLLKPNGYTLIVTPFLIKVHHAPNDYSRWTLLGLKSIIEFAGFNPSQISGGQWGNKACISANFYKWLKYNYFFHSLKNEEEFPVVIWCFAKK